MKDSNDYSTFPESDCIVNYIFDRHRKGLYTLILITGLSGTGKSSSSIRLGEITSEKIHGENTVDEKCIVDSLLGLLRELKTAKKPGKIIVIEELSVLFPSRRSMAAENVTIGRILDTCRKKQVILITNAPIFTSVDSHIRAMAHILIETQKIVKRQGVVVSKSWRLQTNPHSGKTYRHRFRRKNREVSLFITRKPNSEVWDNYERDKDKFLDDLYDRLEKQTQKKQDKVDKELGIPQKRRIRKNRGINDRYLKIYSMVKTKGIKYKEIAKMEGCSIPRIAQIIKKVEENTQIC